jgi:hypothetical protein
MTFKECMKSELDLFTTPSIQKSVLKTEEVSYRPTTSLENSSSIEFISLGHGNTYRDLSSINLKLQLQLVNTDKTPSPPTPGIVNNNLHSLFRQCTVYLNGKPISQSNVNYHYRTYIENLLNYGNDAVTTHLETSGWILDKGKLDSLAKNDNSGLETRKKWFESGSVLEVMGKVHCDIFNQSKLLLNNVDIRIVFSLEKPEFYMMEEDAKSSYLKIMDATLFMNHATINPSILIAHEKVLETSNAHYPYKRVEVKSYTIPSGTFNLSLDNVVLGLLPNLLIFAMVDNDAYTGKRSKNPYNFKHQKLSSFNLVINGRPLPNQPILMDFKEKPPISTRAYSTLFKGIGIHYFDKGHQITKEFYDRGCFMLIFDLTTDNSYGNSCGNLLNDGNLSIEGRFSDSLVSPITCLVYTEFDAHIEIDKNRNVFTSF